MIGTLSVASLALISGVSARTFTVINQCSYTVWPGMFTNLLVGSDIPSQPNGWEQAAGATVSFAVPDNWTAGRIWARTECDFSTVQGPTSCATGGCNGGLVVMLLPELLGVPPATLAEWTLSGDQDLDYYDVSVVDGFNVPIEVTITDTSCHTASCPTNLNTGCPAELQVKDASGAIVGCNSACNANLDGNQADSPNCCSGSFDTPQTCPPSGVADYDFFSGYVIQNAWNGHYATVEDGIGTGISVVGNAFPATWVLEECPQYARGDGGRCFRIRWPNSRFMIDLEGYGCVKDGTRIQLAYEHQPVHPCQVWRFEEVCQASLVSDSQTSPFMYTLDTANESEDEPDDDVSDSFYDAFEDGVMMVVPAQERERKPGHGRVVIETTTTTTITKKMYI
ncbi:hypothetical protein D9757_009480 [Collybiopsis confluens]|uniref:Thaumatin-like protein n=1 Tax=Collybiopsis confluens TaxID=2823264 RepID=A0A8H5M144_9AGAR|nr:hypothetical protein D9757_009480 [Collybiopsis confluens]